MLYLLDANVLIRASQDYYAIDSVPEFWEWLSYMAEQGYVKIPKEVFVEITEGPTGDDPLYKWLNEDGVKKCLLLDEAADVANVRQVIHEGYATDLNDAELIEIGQDPFLIAYARQGEGRRVVTVEVSAPSKRRHNKKIPNVCDHFQVAWCTPFVFFRELGFSTQWKKKLEESSLFKLSVQGSGLDAALGGYIEE
jgi:hypothetical protein